MCNEIIIEIIKINLKSTHAINSFMRWMHGYELIFVYQHNILKPISLKKLGMKLPMHISTYNLKLEWNYQCICSIGNRKYEILNYSKENSILVSIPQ